MALQIDLAPDGRMRITIFEGHHVLVPFGELGLQVVRELLVAQHMNDKRIATRPSLTQAQVEDLIKAWKAKRPRSEFDVDLTEFGL